MRRQREMDRIIEHRRQVLIYAHFLTKFGED